MKEIIQSTSHTIVVGDHSIYLNRTWCLWELFLAIQSDATIHFHFTQQRPHSINAIDLLSSATTYPEDKESILREVGGETGTCIVNSVVTGYLAKTLGVEVIEEIQETSDLMAQLEALTTDQVRKRDFLYNIIKQ